MKQLRALSALALAAAAALSGCATLGSPQAAQQALLSSAPPPRERACRVAEAPSALPAAGELVDAAALRAAAAELWRAEGSPRGYVLFSLRYDRFGSNVRRAVLEHTVSDVLADSLQKLVFAHRREVRPADGEWGVRLRVDLGEEPALRVGRWQVCAPTPRDTRLADASLSVSSLWDVRDTSLPDPQARVWLRVRLDASGTVTGARVERTPVRGMAEWRLLNLVRTIPFQPALEDGYPVPAETSISLPLSRAGEVYGLTR